MKVSVIIPTYNRAGVIGRAIESVLSQSLRPDEVIVVDDGSTDNTEEVIRKFEPRISYIRQENQGQAVARNTGVSAANGFWLAFLDSDDWWHPEKLERQVAFLQKHPADVCFHDFRLLDPIEKWCIESWNAHCYGNGHPQLQTGYIDDPIACVLRSADILFTSSLMMTRQAFDHAGGYYRRFRRCQDVDFHLRLARCAKFAFIDEPLMVKEHNKVIPSEFTYQMRLQLLRENLLRCVQDGDWNASHIMQKALYRQLRAIAGQCRRSGRYGKAVYYYVTSILSSVAPLRGAMPQICRLLS